MAATLKVIVAGFATFVEEFLEEESVQEEEDVLEEFLPLFYANNLLSERRKAVRIESYAETVVPNYNLSEFRSLVKWTFSSFVASLTVMIFAFAKGKGESFALVSPRRNISTSLDTLRLHYRRNHFPDLFLLVVND